jgi:glycosyltransferase involved in cell wall biosynthesis
VEWGVFQMFLNFTQIMNIALLFSLSPPSTGGCAVYSDILVKGLQIDRRVDSVWLLTEYAGTNFYEKVGNTKIYRILPPRDSRPKRKWPIHALLFVLNQFLIACYFLVARIWFPRNLIAHVHNRYGRAWLGYFLKSINIPSVLDIRDRLYLQSGIKCYDKLICASSNIMSDIEGLGYYKKSVELTVPIDLIEIRSALSTEQIISGDYIVFVGAITENKGVFILIEAFKKSSLFERNIKLVFVGPNLSNEAFCKSYDKGIVYLGPRSRMDVLNIICHAKLLALPSLSEGMPRVALEAIALKTPVILPGGVPDFDLFCAGSVISDMSAIGLARMLNQPLHNFLCTSFPIDNHSSLGYTDNIIERVYLHF